MSEPLTSKTVTPSEIRLAVEWLAANANGVSLVDWEPRSQTLLNAADQVERLQKELADAVSAAQGSHHALGMALQRAPEPPQPTSKRVDLPPCPACRLSDSIVTFHIGADEGTVTCRRCKVQTYGPGALLVWKRFRLTPSEPPQPGAKERIDKLLTRVAARFPASVTPSTLLAIHPAEWIELANEVTQLRQRLPAETKPSHQASATERLHRICDALSEQLHESPFTREEWDNLDKVVVAAGNLVRRMEAIYESPAFKSVWTLSMVHGVPYSGPKWNVEFDALKNALGHESPLKAAAEPMPRYSCFVAGCPGNHISKRGVCSSQNG